MEFAGFKTFQRTGMILSATENLSMGANAMSIGALTDTVTMEASGVAVQTASASGPRRSPVLNQMDTVGEMKLLINNYQAEHSGNGGMIGNMVNKSGGRDFSGNLYWFGRNEALMPTTFSITATRLKSILKRAKPRDRSTALPVSSPDKLDLVLVLETEK